MTLPKKLNVLFVCGRNNRRSPTAERIFKNDRRMSVRSAGVADTSKRKLTEADLAWADLVLVMERKYASRIRDAFRQLESLPPIESLDISDEYIFMQAELVEALRTAVADVLEELELEKDLWAANTRVARESRKSCE
jgi:predicted protein tyrosine phosphatase